MILAHSLRRVATKIATRVGATDRMVEDMAATRTDGDQNGGILIDGRGCRGPRGIVLLYTNSIGAGSVWRVDVDIVSP